MGSRVPFFAPQFDLHFVFVLPFDVKHLPAGVSPFNPFHVDAEGLVPHFQVDRLHILQFGILDSFLLDKRSRIVRHVLQAMLADFEQSDVQFEGQSAGVDGATDLLIQLVDRQLRQRIVTRGVRTGRGRRRAHFQ